MIVFSLEARILERILESVFERAIGRQLLREFLFPFLNKVIMILCELPGTRFIVERQ